MEVFFLGLHEKKKTISLPCCLLELNIAHLVPAARPWLVPNPQSLGRSSQVPVRAARHVSRNGSKCNYRMTKAGSSKSFSLIETGSGGLKGHRELTAGAMRRLKEPGWNDKLLVLFSESPWCERVTTLSVKGRVSSCVMISYLMSIELSRVLVTTPHCGINRFEAGEAEL